MSINLARNAIRQRRNLLKKKINPVLAFGIILCLCAAVFLAVDKKKKDIESIAPAMIKIPPRTKKEEIKIPDIPKKIFVPGKFSMDTIKKKGCVADGMLSGYGGNTEKMIGLIERSQCQYLHRALETWLESPDLDKAAEIMAEVDKPGLVFGMFIAEAINKKSDYTDPESGKKFDFSEMCRKDTDNAWGEHTCLPSFERPEYKQYIELITRKAMDIGIQSFLFGQIHYQNQQDLANSELPNVVRDMRRYAKKKNLQVVIGAQTNSITDQKYLGLFDYIEGGLGIDMGGNVEDGPCWSGKSSCWALLWNDIFRANAKNVILNLDWSGIPNDDMSKFARMDQETRIKTLDNLYHYFTSRQIGFLMPFLAPLYPENNGCYGPQKRFYSPDNRYHCKDEDKINNILAGKK